MQACDKRAAVLLLLRSVVAALPMPVLMQAALAVDQSVLEKLPNVSVPQPGRYVSGAINAQDIEALREAGVRHVINLRTPQESAQFDEARAVTEQGLVYHSLPIEGRQALTQQNVRELDRLLEQIGDEPALLHCASGNRVGALIALREAWLKGRSADAAVAEGKRWGLTGLEGAVRAALADEQRAQP